MRCGYCGGQLVWDYERGEVVCSSCGIVHHQLADFEVAEYRVEPASRSELVKKHSEVARHAKLKEYKYIVKLYARCRKITARKPWLDVDYYKVLSTGKFVLTLTSEASLKARKNVEEYGYWDILKKGLEIVLRVNPALLARTERCKYALAYMVARKLESGRLPPQEEVTRIFNISSTSYKRLCTIASRVAASAQSL